MNEPQNPAEETIRKGLEPAHASSDTLSRRVLNAIGGRSPAEMKALHAFQFLPRLSAAASLLLVLLVALTWLLTPAPSTDVDLAESDPAPIDLQFEEGFDTSTPSTVLTALVIEGMDP